MSMEVIFSYYIIFTNNASQFPRPKTIVKAKSEKAMGVKVEFIFIASLKQTFLRCHSDMNAVLFAKTLNRAAKESG